MGIETPEIVPQTKEQELQNILNNSKEKISGLNDNISGISHLVEIINPEEFNKLCFNNLEIA